MSALKCVVDCNTKWLHISISYFNALDKQPLPNKKTAFVYWLVHGIGIVYLGYRCDRSVLISHPHSK